MKILELHFRNINSLAGEFSIDFTHPSLAEAGVFMITGPTGAGKTTILDAISYALYGQTPRQKDITLSANEVMSRKASDCEASVVFECGDRRYRAQTSQRRRKARSSTKDPKPFAEPRRSLEVLGQDGLWYPLGTQTQSVRQQVKELSGLSFENFKRCMMLPQGDFANFLKASDKDRSEVLSTITGTDIYLRIGEYVHQKVSDLEQALSAYREQEVLSDEARRELRENCDQARLSFSGYRQRHRELSELIAWRNALEKEQLATDAALAERRAAEMELRGFESDGRLEHMVLGQRAAKVEAAERDCLLLQRQLREAGEHLSVLDNSLRELEPLLREAGRLHFGAQQRLEGEGKVLREELQRIGQQLRPLETERDSLAAETRSAFKVMQEAQQDAVRAESEAVRTGQLLKLAVYHAGLAQQRLDALQADKDLPAALSGIVQAWQRCIPYRALDPELIQDSADGVQARLQALDSQLGDALSDASFEQRVLTLAELRKLADLESGLADSGQRLQELTRQVGQAQAIQKALPSLEEAGLRVQQAQESYDLISHQSSIEEKLELLYREFRDGKRDCCPCCGATTCSGRHPLSGNALSEADERCRVTREEHQQLMRRHEQVLQTLREAELQLHTEQNQQRSRQAEYQSLLCRLHLPDSRPETSELILRQEAQLQELNTWQQEQKKLQALIPALQARDAFNAAISPFTADKPRTFAAALACLSSLQARSSAYTEAAAALQNAGQERGRAALLADTAQQQRTEKHQVLQNALQTHDTLQQKLSALCASLERDWGATSSAERISAITHQLDTLREAEKTTREQLNALQADQKKQQGQYEQQKQQQKALTAELQKSLDSFRCALRQQQFDSQSAYLNAKPFIADCEQLQREYTQRQQTLTEKHAAAGVRLQHLRDLQTRHACDLPRQELQRQLDECCAAEQAAEEQLQRLTSALSVDDHQRDANRRIQQQAVPIREELEHWRRLYAILGGTKDSFLRYAQVITFQQLIRHANAQLAELNDRYTLVLDPRNPLQLSIIDSYQDDAPRSCSNLSGGESFIVSLALALGLSHMTGDTRIDSLFLDEGFGTLDHDTLDNVMNCLQILRQKGRLIGIITHVEQLKEYIPHGIEVLPSGRDGYSTLASHPAITISPSS